MPRPRHIPSRPASARRPGVAFGHPVAQAAALDDLASHLRTTRIGLYQQQDGEPARGYLAHLAWMLGLGAEVALHTGDDAARSLHSTLRTLVAEVCVRDGYCWRADLAGVLDEAVGHAHRLITRHAAIALTMQPGADWLAVRIRDGLVQASDVAGAEIYAGVRP